MKIFLIGFMGAGKTHWGRQLAQKLGMPFFDLDEKIVEQAGKPISEIFEAQGEEQFRLMEKDVLYLLTESHASFVMACGGGTPCFFNNIDYLKSKGTAVWINSSVDTLYQRLVGEKPHRPLIRDVPDNQLKSFITKKYSGRKIFYQQATVILPEEDLTLEKMVQCIFHAND
jgi:shikimate kinase